MTEIEPTSRTMKELAQEALDVQNACNPLGLSRSFAIACLDLGRHLCGSAQVSQHPVFMMWVSKFDSLCYVSDLDRFGVAYADCQARAAA